RHLLPQFGLRVSVLLDSSGANTTAAAAVWAANQHVQLENASVLVLAGTGPVGQRAARLLAGKGAHVRVGSRQHERAARVCDAIRARVPGARVEPTVTTSTEALTAALAGCAVVVSAGAAGISLLRREVRKACPDLR